MDTEVVGTSGAVYCALQQNSRQKPACSSQKRLRVHHHHSAQYCQSQRRCCRTSKSSLFTWLLLGSVALVLLSAVTLTSAIHSDYSSDEGEELCEAPTDQQVPGCSAKSTKSTIMGGDAERERTFIMIKPDGVQRGLVGEIIKRFEQKGFHLVSMKFMWASEDLLKKHYADLAARPFFPGLVKYMSSGPVVPMVWEGTNVVKTGRVMLGETNPAASAPGTIRGDYCIEVGRNICHGSDSVESAKKEIALWFKPEEQIKWKSVEDPWLYE